MAIYTMLEKGSTGSDVKKLQSSLVNAGYDVGSSGVDGIYGSATQRAVSNYQRDQGLTVDGIAGDETLSSLYGQETQEEETPESLYEKALAELDRLTEEKPEYAGSYEEDLAEIYAQLLAREEFSYDPASDPVYRQYREQYARQGRLAMEDTLGRGAGLTGGYSNSYAQQAGQQAYQKYLDQLTQAEAQLYSRAKDRYNSGTQALSDRYAALEDLSRTEYSRYQDALEQYRKDLALAQSKAKDAYDRWYDERKLASR